MSAETIVAPATPPGTGAVGVVRVSGPAARHIAASLIGSLPEPRVATLRTFRASTGRAIDQGLVLFFPAPASFTGEDCLELQGHGGPVVLDLLIDRCLELGARMARPGEFTERAFLNGKIDLLQAEATADLIGAATQAAARLAVRSLQGAFSRRIECLGRELTTLRAHLEATLDFPDEDIDFSRDSPFQPILADLLTSIRDTISEAEQGERVREGITVVIAGPPNAGKSSLFNTLAQDDAAIVTPVPGTTRDVLSRDLQFDGFPVRLIDTAGLRESSEPIEQEGVRRAHAQIALADLVLWVFDASQGVSQDEFGALPPDIPTTLVRNKVDLPVPTPRAEPMPPGFAVVEVSALTGHGIEGLRQHVRERFGFQVVDEGSFIARLRHIDGLRRAHRAMQAAQQALDARSGAEIVALELSEAQAALGEIIGAVSTDDLLATIFSTFCIGK
jgi:tRNA modification GTPase